MDFSTVNWLGIFLATIASFLLGFCWYHSRVFGSRWQREVGLSDEELNQGNIAGVFGGGFVLIFILMFVLDTYIIDGIFAAIKTGIYLGIGIGTTVLGINYVFARRSVVLWLIDAGYIIVVMAVGGLLLSVV